MTDETTPPAESTASGELPNEAALRRSLRQNWPVVAELDLEFDYAALPALEPRIPTALLAPGQEPGAGAGQA
jgi:hypothetical protein